MSDAFKDWYELQYKDDPKPEGAHGWIQWKGTDVCIDLTCECGETDHFDGDFFYAYRCRKCGKEYALAQHIRLLPAVPGGGHEPKEGNADD